MANHRPVCGWAVSLLMAVGCSQGSSSKDAVAPDSLRASDSSAHDAVGDTSTPPDTVVAPETSNPPGADADNRDTRGVDTERRDTRGADTKTHFDATDAPGIPSDAAAADAPIATVDAVPSADAGFPETGSPVDGGLAYLFPAGPTYTTPSGSKTLSRTTTWAPGVPGGVPNIAEVCATLSPSGGNDDQAINAAIQACPAHQVVKLNPGDYHIAEMIRLNKNDVVLRGSGGPGAAKAQQTRLLAQSDLYGTVVILGAHPFPDAKGISANCTADALQGTSTVTVSSTKGFAVGDLVMVDMLVDPADDLASWITTAPAGGTGLAYPYAKYNPDRSPKGSDSRQWFARADRPIAQVMEIAAVSGNTLTFSTPFHMTFDVGHSAQVTAFTYDGDNGRPAPASRVGLEDVYVSGVPAPGSDSQYNNVAFRLAKESWVRNVETDQSNGYGIGFDSSFRCEIRDSYVHSTITPEPGGAGYGLEFSGGSADNLIENTISWNFDKIMVMRAGGGGNVIGYNYMDDGWIDYQPDFVESGMNAAHMATSHFELFEGNLSFSMGTDGTWGNNIFITWMRNLATTHRSAWPPLNSYGYNTGKDGSKEGPGCKVSSYDDWNQECIPYTDYANRAAVQVAAADVFFNYVGNVLGSQQMPMAPPRYFTGFAYEDSQSDTDVPMWSIGHDQDGNSNDVYDPGVLNTLFRDGNYDYATKSTHWTAGTQSLPSSLYLKGKPAFFGSYEWPWVDGSNASKPYITSPYEYYPLTTALGTFATSGAYVTHPGYQLPAFRRFLLLKGIVPASASCSAASPASAPAECRLLLTGVVPQ